jgi:hypothetical protein
VRTRYKNQEIARTLSALAGADNLALVEYQLGQTGSQHINNYMKVFPNKTQRDLWDICYALVKAEIFIIDRVEQVFNEKLLGEEVNTIRTGAVVYFAINPNMPPYALDIVLALWPDALQRYGSAATE